VYEFQPAPNKHFHNFRTMIGLERVWILSTLVSLVWGLQPAAKILFCSLIRDSKTNKWMWLEKKSGRRRKKQFVFVDEEEKKKKKKEPND
jgi:hypothetical protein